MDNGYQYAELSPRVKNEIRRLETQLARDTGRQITLIAYEGCTPTHAFNDLQRQGGAELKQKTFFSEDNLYGNITQWHI